jgi:two-component system OmpR family sensor kinase/two-component system sensor histidine kinase BaeS
VQLSLAFAFVILVAVGSVALLADLTAGQAFRRYLTYSDRSPHQTLSSYLVEYYQANGNWEGVAYLLDDLGLHAEGPPRFPPRGAQGTVARPEARLQIVLAGDDGRVIYDGAEHRPGRRLSHDESAAAFEVIVDDQVVGELVIAWPTRMANLGPLEQAFTKRTRQLLIAGAALAATIALLPGLFISKSLTAPLGRLAEAARAVAARDFSRRVIVEGSEELAEVARAFNDMVAALEQSEVRRRDMVADVAHELRTPLSVVQGNLRAILDGVYPLEESEISRLYDETRVLGRLVDDLRELALADAGQLSLDLQPTDLTPVIQVTVQNMSLAAEAQAVALTTELQSDLPTATADSDRLAQVLRNLLVNALRHTSAGGSVTVAASRFEDMVRISVADTGEGIIAADLPRVFDRFWRAERSRTRPDRLPGGSGLGLSVAKSIVEAHGGRIWAESLKGKGSVFHFTLPRYEDPFEDRVPPARHSTP